jgi:hypothetical protein
MLSRVTRMSFSTGSPKFTANASAKAPLKRLRCQAVSFALVDTSTEPWTR